MSLKERIEKVFADLFPINRSLTGKGVHETLNYLLENFSLNARKGVFSGKNLMITGGLEKMSRAEAKTLAEENGAKVFGSLSKKLNYLVVGNSKPTKSKIEKAESLNIKILNEEEWYKLLKF